MNKASNEPYMGSAINEHIAQPLKEEAETIIKEIEDLIGLITQGNNVAANLEKVENLKVNVLKMMDGNDALRDVYIQVENKTTLAKYAAKRTKIKLFEALDKLTYPSQDSEKASKKKTGHNNIFGQILAEHENSESGKVDLAELIQHVNEGDLLKEFSAGELGMLKPTPVANFTQNKISLANKK